MKKAPPSLTTCDQLLEFINRTLPLIDPRHRPEVTATRDTELFETGLLDSLAIIHLIAFIERLTGQEISYKMLVMKHFKTPEHIAKTFLNQATPTS